MKFDDLLITVAFCCWIWQKGDMLRHLRVEFSGAIYHVTIRGNARQKIFNDDHDRKRFLQRLADSVETYGERLYAANLTRIRDQVREGALERLSAWPGPACAKRSGAGRRDAIAETGGGFEWEGPIARPLKNDFYSAMVFVKE
jgi:hypothetical protein